MKKERKLCICLTPRQVIGSVLLAISVVNLIIVGTAFELTFPDPVPTSTVTQTVFTATVTPLTPTVATSNTSTATLDATDTPTPTITLTPTATFTSTSTNTSTPTDTPLPPPTQCTPRYYWQVYKVQQGDTLFSLGIATGSSVEELMKANCLAGTVIYHGQSLYVPYLPVPPTTVPPTATFTPTAPGPSDPYVTTPAANSETIIQSSFVCYSIGEAKVSVTYIIQFSVALYDPEGISSVVVEYQVNDGPSLEAKMSLAGASYVASGPLSIVYGENDVVRYSYRITDSTGNSTDPAEDETSLVSCLG